MAKQSYEITTFTSGVIGAPSETDIPENAAAYSLNINPTAEDGTLTAIHEDTVLTSGTGFETGAKTVQTLLINRGAMATTTTVNVTAIAEHTDGNVKLTASSHSLTAGDVIKFTATAGGTGLNGYLTVVESVDSNNFTVNFDYTDISSALPTGSPLGTYILHKDVSADDQDYKGGNFTIETYNASYELKKYYIVFQQANVPAEADVVSIDDHTTTLVNLATSDTPANVATKLQTALNNLDGITATVNTATITISPDVTVKVDLATIETTDNADVHSLNADNIRVDSTTITATTTTTGAGSVVNLNDMALLNLDKKEYTLFGIDYNNDKIFKWEDIYNSDNRNTLTEFSSGVSHDSKSTMVKRNRNVFIGLGAGESFKTQWVGKIKKTQIAIEIDGWYIENDELISMPSSAAPFSFDVMISQQIHNNNTAFNEQQCYHAEVSGLNTISSGTANLASHLHTAAGKLYSIGDGDSNDVNEYGKTNDSVPGIGWCFKITDTNDTSDGKLLAAKQYKYDPSTSLVAGDVFMIVDQGESDNDPTPVLEYIGNTTSTEPAFFIAAVEGTTKVHKVSTAPGTTDFSTETDRISTLDLSEHLEGDAISTIAICRTPLTSGSSVSTSKYMYYGDGTIDNDHIADQRCRPLHMMYWVATENGNLYRMNLTDFHSQNSDSDYQGAIKDAKLTLDYSNIARCQDSEYDGQFKHWYGGIYGAKRFNSVAYSTTSYTWIFDQYEGTDTNIPGNSGIWAESQTWSREPSNSQICGVIETWNNATDTTQVPASSACSDLARYVYDDDSDNAGLGANHYPDVGYMDHHHAQKHESGTFEQYAADKTMFIKTPSGNDNHGFDTGNVLTGFTNKDGKGNENYHGNTIVTKVRGLNEFQVLGTHNTADTDADSFPYYSSKVWLLWKRKNNSGFSKWDLMLYNFCPTTVQSDSVLVYDRTPPYDECVKNHNTVNSVENRGYWQTGEADFYIQKSTHMLGKGPIDTANIQDQGFGSWHSATNDGPRTSYVMRRDGSAVSFGNARAYYSHCSFGNFIGFDGSNEGEFRTIKPFSHSLKTLKPLMEIPSDTHEILYTDNPYSTASGNHLYEWQHGANKHQVNFMGIVNGRMAIEGFRSNYRLNDGGDHNANIIRQNDFKNYNNSVVMFNITDTGSAKGDTRTYMGHYESTHSSSAHVNQLSTLHYADGGKFKKRCVYKSSSSDHVSTRGSGRISSNNNLYYTSGTYSMYDGTKLVPSTVPFPNDVGVTMYQGQIGDYLYIDRKWVSSEPRLGYTYKNHHNSYINCYESEESTSRIYGRLQSSSRFYDGGGNNSQTLKIRGINGHIVGDVIANGTSNPSNDTTGHHFERRSYQQQIGTIKSYYSTNSGTFYGDEAFHNTAITNAGNKYSSTTSQAQMTYDLNRYPLAYDIIAPFSASMREIDFSGSIDLVRSIDPVMNTNLNWDDHMMLTSSTSIGGDYSTTISLLEPHNNSYPSSAGSSVSAFYPHNNAFMFGLVPKEFSTEFTSHTKLITLPITPNENIGSGNPFGTVWGCGNARISNVNKEFISPMLSNNIDFGSSQFAAFDTDDFIQQDPLLTFDNELGSGTELPQDANIKYKVSLLYDGYQESPLSSFFYDKTMSANKDSHDVTINISPDFRFSPRVTHMLIYRKNQANDLYRLVKQVSLEDKGWVLQDGRYKFTFRDSKRFASYSALTGIDEENTNTSLNYSISAQINDELFVGLAWHKDVEDDVSKYIYKSKPGNFSQFDYNKDFLVLPGIPTALASFNGKIYAFDRSNTYIINPQQMFIEDTFEGVGCLSQDSLVVTEFGMCFADVNNIYLQTGAGAQPIGNNIIDVSTYEGWKIGWQKAVKYSEETIETDPFVFYDGESNSFVCFVHGSCDQNCNPNVSRAWVYSITRNRWDYWEAPKVEKAVQGLDGDIIISDGNLLYNYKDNTTKRDWKWLSKKLSITKQTTTKRMHKIKLQGTHTLDTISTPPQWNDDMSVYVDGEIQQLEFATVNVTKNKGFTKEFSGCFLYATLAIDGVTVTLRGLNQLEIGGAIPPIGTYILIDEEIMMVTAHPSATSLTVTRAQLGTTAVVHTYDESTQGTEGLEGQRIYNVCPVIKLPSGCKGKLIEVKFENQKSSIDSFSVEFIDKGTR